MGRGELSFRRWCQKNKEREGDGDGEKEEGKEGVTEKIETSGMLAPKPCLLEEATSLIGRLPDPSQFPGE